MKAMALIFVLADCPICNAYVPELNRLHEAFCSSGDRPVRRSCGLRHHGPAGQHHAKEYGLLPLVAIDSRHQWVKKAGATIAPPGRRFFPSG